MARFLLIWEMGANFGHVHSLLPLAFALRDRGHDVSFALKEKHHIAQVSATHGFDCRLSPQLAPRPPSAQPLLSYADVLRHAGFNDSDTLYAKVCEWRTLFAEASPDVLIINCAPTAALAACGTKYKTALFGHGYEVPPLLAPLPALRPWLKAPAAEISALESQVVLSVNRVMNRLNQAPITHLKEIFQTDERILTTIRELDHYPERPPEKYRDLVTDTSQGEPFQWQGEKEHRVFAYLRARNVDIVKIASQMNHPRCEYALVAPDASDEDCLRLSCDSVRVFNRPLKIDDVMAGCSAALHHGGMATTISFLRRAVPVLILPSQLEQFLSGRNIQQRGYGLMLNPRDPAFDLSRPLAHLLKEPGFRVKAKAFSAKYGKGSSNEWAGGIADRLCEIACVGNEAGSPGKGGQP